MSQRTKLLFLLVVLLSIMTTTHYLEITSKFMKDLRSSGDKYSQQTSTSVRATSGLDTTIGSSSNPPVTKRKFNVTRQPTNPNANANANVPTASPPTTNPKQTRTQAPTFVYTLPPGSNTTNLSISLPSSEWLEDIDTYTNVLGCGAYKCAFRSITGKHGYLVAILLPQEVASAKTAVDMAEYFAATFGIRHTVLARPITTDKRMNRNVSQKTIPNLTNDVLKGNKGVYKALASRLRRGKGGLKERGHNFKKQKQRKKHKKHQKEF